MLLHEGLTHIDSQTKVAFYFHFKFPTLLSLNTAGARLTSREKHPVFVATKTAVNVPVSPEKHLGLSPKHNQTSAKTQTKSQMFCCCCTFLPCSLCLS